MSNQQGDFVIFLWPSHTIWTLNISIDCLPTQIWSASYAPFLTCLFNKPPTGHFYDVKKRYFQNVGAYVVVSNTKEYHRKKLQPKDKELNQMSGN